MFFLDYSNILISVLNCNDNQITAKYLCQCSASNDAHLNIRNIINYIHGTFSNGRIYRSIEVTELGLPTRPPLDCKVFKSVQNLVSIVFKRGRHRQEKRVDSTLVADVVTLVAGKHECVSDCAGITCVCKLTSSVLPTTHRIIVMSGDADMEPAVTKALSRGYYVDVFAFKETCTKIYNCDKFKNHPRFDLKKFS